MKEIDEIKGIRKVLFFVYPKPQILHINQFCRTSANIGLPFSLLFFYIKGVTQCTQLLDAAWQSRLWEPGARSAQAGTTRTDENGLCLLCLAYWCTPWAR